MLIQISSGQGPIECSIGVEKFCTSLLAEFPGSRIVSVNKDHSGNGYKSAIMEFEGDVAFLEGTILWICKSPVRPDHKRKNWFLTVDVLNERDDDLTFDMADVKLETMHCGGKGGQNVNKVESGVRIRHIPTGIILECTEERSQYQNKQRAIRRLRAVLEAAELEGAAQSVRDARSKHTQIVRGNPIRTYEGMGFMLKE